MIPIFQPKSICHHVTRIDPHSKGQRGEGEERERGSVSQQNKILIFSSQALAQSDSDVTGSVLAALYPFIHSSLQRRINLVYYYNLGLIFILSFTSVRITLYSQEELVKSGNMVTLLQEIQTGGNLCPLFRVYSNTFKRRSSAHVV